MPLVFEVQSSNMKNLTHKLLSAASLIPALIFGWYFLRIWFAPDDCLDFGGSFDYVEWECNHTHKNPYIHVPVYHFVSFWLFVIGIIFALLTCIALKACRNTTQQEIRR